MTRIARGRIRLQRQRVDLCALLHRVVDDHEQLFATNGLELQLAVADEGLSVDADPARLAQIVGNLLQNAAKFTPPGSRTTVSVRSTDDGRAEISVADTGRGIPPDLLPRLFEPFVQADATLNRSAGGLGLGLALVKGLVELHGGTVAAHNDGPGLGARFVVTIPVRSIALSGYALPEDAERARAAGFDLHLAKPLREPRASIGGRPLPPDQGGCRATLRRRRGISIAPPFRASAAVTRA